MPTDSVPADLRSQTAVVCGALALVIAVSTLLRGRVRPVHFLFSAFAADIGLWYLSQSLSRFFPTSIWDDFTMILAVLLPQLALHLFEAMVPYEQNRRPRLLRVAGVLAVPMVVLVLGFRKDPWLGGAVFLYVFALVTAGLYELGRRGAQSSSRSTQRRVQILVVIGALAGLASVVDLLSVFIPDLPPVGAVLSVVFLFVLAQALRHERLLDIYEIFARLLVATAIAFLIAFIFYVVITYSSFKLMYLNAVIAAIVILVVFEPLREQVEEQIQRFFRERFDLERSITEAKRRLVHILEVEEMGSIVMLALDQSRRVTTAALYLRDEDGSGFDRIADLGTKVPPRIEFATAHALIDRIEVAPLAIEQLELEVRESRARGMRPDAGEAVLTAAAVLGSLRHGVVIGIHADSGALTGLLAVADNRVRDAFSPEEVALLESLAAQIGVIIENSHVYAQMKERDRLAVLGQMAAGLAHEIRNPLGAIKGAAQLLADPDPNGREPDAATKEFLGIILEEVERLNRVVGSVLDLSRAHQDTVVPTDVNATIRRTLQILSTERVRDDLQVDITLDPSLPRVAIDPEQLRQVLMNLFHNAAQAMKGHGLVAISTRIRFGRGTRPGSGGPEERFVELTVTDNGPGISQKVLQNIFLPFFTTKDTGTGLGLAISQRIVQDAGGRIEVRSYEGKGSSFAVILPAAMDVLGTPTPSPARPAEVLQSPAASDPAAP